MLHECYTIETCSDKLLQFRYYVQPCFATPCNLRLLTVHRLLNVHSGRQAAAYFRPPFVSWVLYPSWNSNLQRRKRRRTVWCTQNKSNGSKFVQSNSQASSTTSVRNQASIAIFFTRTYSQPTQRSNKRSGSHLTKEFRATVQRNEKQSLLLQQRRVEVSHLWSQVGTVIALEASVKTQFSFYPAKFVGSYYCSLWRRLKDNWRTHMISKNTQTRKHAH